MFVIIVNSDADLGCQARFNITKQFEIFIDMYHFFYEESSHGLTWKYIRCIFAIIVNKCDNICSIFSRLQRERQKFSLSIFDRLDLNPSVRCASQHRCHIMKTRDRFNLPFRKSLTTRDIPFLFQILLLVPLFLLRVSLPI